MPQNVAFDHGLHCFLTESPIRIRSRKIPPDNHENGNELVQVTGVGNSTLLKWINHKCAAHLFMFLILTPNKMSLLSPSWSDY